MIITGRQLARLIELNELVRGFIDLKTQLQPHGFDLTVREVQRLEESGRVDFDNRQRRVPRGTPIPWPGEWLHLGPGAYRVLFNEVLNMPPDLAAMGRPRSSLVRSGVALHTSVWDAGYRGRSEALLSVLNPAGFDLGRNARILQLVFFRLDQQVLMEDAYSGQYQQENL